MMNAKKNGKGVILVPQEGSFWSPQPGRPGLGPDARIFATRIFGPDSLNFGPDSPDFGSDSPDFGLDSPDFGPDFGPVNSLTLLRTSAIQTPPPP